MKKKRKQIKKRNKERKKERKLGYGETVILWKTNSVKIMEALKSIRRALNEKRK